MKLFLPCLMLLLVLSTSCEQAPATDQATQAVEEPTGAENVAYKWGGMALEATALDTERFKPRPTITSRFLGLIFTAVFDAWSRYDEKAIPVYLEGVDRRPVAEQSLENKEKDMLLTAP